MESQRDRQKLQRRAEILRAAATLFAARGYHGTTIAGIATEMGAPKSAVGYHQFETKEAIAIAIVEQQRARWLSLISRVTQGPGSALEHLLTILLSAAIDARMNPLAAAAARLSAESRASGIALPPATFRWRTISQGLVVKSLAEGLIRSARSADEIVGFILDASYGVFTAENNGFEAPETRTNLLRLWSDLLVALNVEQPSEVLAGVRVVDLEDASIL